MKSFRDQTFYELLDVPVGASPEVVEEAFVRAFALYASDSIALYSLVDDRESEALRQKLEEARETLRAPERRAAYDRALGLPVVAVTEPEPAQVIALVPASAPPPETDAAPAPPVVEVPVAVEAAAAVEASAAVEAAAPVVEAPPVEAAPAAEATPDVPPVPSEPPVAPARPRDAPARPKIPDVGPESEFNGELLRQLREARGLSLQTVADRTRIGRSHIENIEADRYKALPATVYLRGMLVSLAREYKTNPEWVTRSYLGLAAAAGKG